MTKFHAWAPAAIFLLGSVLTLGVDGQRHLVLREDLGAAVPSTLLGMPSVDLEVSQEEQVVAGMDEYLLRSYGRGQQPASAAPAAGSFSLYVGYYGSQAQGRTIHSPKNCLPGGGWEALNASEATIATASGPIPVNRYILQREDERVLVLYWYQGRGRVRANEYLVKLDLLRDSALRNRSDEALVRIVVPIEASEEAAFSAAAQVASEVVPAVDSALPT